MSSPRFPISLARALLAVMPARPLVRAIEIIVPKMQARHPRLFANLARLNPAVVHLEPVDIPHKFVLTLGKEPIRFMLQDESMPKPDARVSGSLQALIDMLEGRADGDMLFFARDIVVEGDTTVIVGLRNTLDREEINLYDEILALCGPFAKPVGQALTLAEHVGKHVRARLHALYPHRHRQTDKEEAHDVLS